MPVPLTPVLHYPVMIRLQNKRKKNLWIFITALVLLAGLCLAFFHHHGHGEDDHDCSVCHFVRQIAVFLIAAVILLQNSSTREFFFSRFESLISFLRFFRHSSRAPPLLA